MMLINTTGVACHGQGEFVMHEDVCFLSVKEAQEIAEKHQNEPDWDIWSDTEAQSKGMSKATEEES